MVPQRSPSAAASSPAVSVTLPGSDLSSVLHSYQVNSSGNHLDLSLLPPEVGTASLLSSVNPVGTSTVYLTVESPAVFTSQCGRGILFASRLPGLLSG